MRATLIDERSASGELPAPDFRVEFVDDSARAHETWRVAEVADVVDVISWAQKVATGRRFTVYLEIPTVRVDQVTIVPVSRG
ncbi:MAG: hypothetical protein KJ792_06735 [Actinobacteria bacterium]|nr:hypothetical protein [Actinomycetota bacterium]MCG2801174.1 hypothetical protein [Cellulomonas sp.]